MLTEAELIKGCKEDNRASQKALYDIYAPKMKAICQRYSNPEEAKDILQEGFLKVFSKINSYSNQGSFEGWIKRIMINTAINHYKKNNKIKHIGISEVENLSSEEDSESDLIFQAGYSEKDLMTALCSLPEPFKIVFNLYYIEDHSHLEISNLLSIDESTSRTRLFRAKKILKEYLTKLSKQKAFRSEGVI